MADGCQGRSVTFSSIKLMMLKNKLKEWDIISFGFLGNRKNIVLKAIQQLDDLLD